MLDFHFAMAAPAIGNIRRLTADEALRMVAAGIVREDEPVELLEGVLVEMSPQGPIHAEATTNLAERLRAAYAGRARIREEKPLAAGTYNLPEPDVAVVRGGPGVYADRHPTGADVILVVELAWSSQEEDRRKAGIYSAGGVPCYWLVDLAGRKVEIWTEPESGSYRALQTLAENDVVALPEIDEKWRVRDLLP
jgi:Uma2 family endonuclease